MSLELEYRRALRPTVTRGDGVLPSEMFCAAGREIIALSRS